MPSLRVEAEQIQHEVDDLQRRICGLLDDAASVTWEPEEEQDLKVRYMVEYFHTGLPPSFRAPEPSMPGQRA